MKTARIQSNTKSVLPWIFVLVVAAALLPALGIAKDANKPTLDEQLMEAAARGDLALAKSLLGKGAEVNPKLDGGWTPLMSAASGRHLDVGKVFPGNYDVTFPMHAEHSSRAGRARVAELLLARGANVHARYQNGPTALMLASQDGHSQIAKLLLGKGADANVKDKNGSTSLMQAAAGAHDDVVKLLLEKGTDVNAADRHAESALTWAARLDLFGASSLAFKVYDDNPAIDPSDEQYWNSLIQALWKRHAEVVKLLKAHGAEMTLLASAMLGDIAETRRLLVSGADVNEKAWDGMTPFMGAAINGHRDVVKRLIAKGADVKTKDDLGRTALAWAARESHTDTAKLLLEKGARVDARDNRGQTPLMRASRKENAALVKLLLENGAAINAEDYYGYTPIILAADSGSPDVVKLLLERGASVKGRYGFSALRAASFMERIIMRDHVVEMIKAHGAEINLFVAAMLGDKKEVQRFIEAGADVKAQMEDGSTPLFLAVEMGHADVVQLLVEKGAAVNVKDSLGTTALQMAKRSGKMKIVEILKAHGAKE